MRFDEVTDDLRFLSALVHELPPEAMTWRRLHARPDVVELVDGWARIFIEFMSGKKVLLPALAWLPPEAEQQKQKVNDPNKIAEFFRAFNG